MYTTFQILFVGVIALILGIEIGIVIGVMHR